MNELITQILQECLRINQHTKHAAFFNLSGHVDSLKVYITLSKEQYNEWIYDRSAHFHIFPESLSELLGDLKAIV